MQLEKQLRVTEDSRDQVLEELHKSEDSLLSAEENAAKVSCPYRKHRESNCLSFFLSLSVCPFLSLLHSHLSLCTITLPAAPFPACPPLSTTFRPCHSWRTSWWLCKRS